MNIGNRAISEIDRRSSPRIKTVPPLVARFSSGMYARTINISDSGICFKTAEAILAENGFLTVEFPPDFIKVNIQIKWQKEPKFTGRFFYGAHILSLESKEMPTMRDVLNKPCSNCILPRSIPGVTFNENGLCNVCQYRTKAGPDERERYADIQTILRTNPNKHKYDCLCLYSGGKDSTFMLYNLVKKYNLRVLAFTLDNRFLSKTTFLNIKNVVSKLKVDNIIYTPPESLVMSLFKCGIAGLQKSRLAKELAFLIGHVCWPCFVMIGMFALKTAIDKNIPNIVIGTTPGQMRQKRYNLIERYTGILDVYRTMDMPFLNMLDKKNKDIIKLSLLEKIKALKVKLIPFYEYYRYDERKAQETAEELFGWQRPPDTDSCSTNCLINTLGIAIHKKRYGVHPYVIPLAHDVRSGLMTREDALKATNVESDFGKASKIAEKLGVKF